MTWLLAHAGLLGLLLFFTFFVGMAVWVFRPGTRSRYNRYAHIPLDKESRS